MLTVCDSERSLSGYPGRTRRLHRDFQIPPLSKVPTKRDWRCFSVRDEIRSYLQAFRQAPPRSPDPYLTCY